METRLLLAPANEHSPYSLLGLQGAGWRWGWGQRENKRKEEKKSHGDACGLLLEFD